MKPFGIRFAVGALGLSAFLFCARPLAAQDTVPESAVSNYRLDENGRILQRLSWSRSNANFFEAEIERLTGPDVWEPVARERTSEIFLEIALPPGQYRYRVLSYNVLGRVAATSQWVGMRIFVAKWPVVESLSPAAYDFDAPSETIAITMYGSDLSEEAEVFLAEKTGAGRHIAPLSVSHRADETSIQAVFPTADFALAQYDMVITNPGGLQARADFAAGFSRKVDSALSLGYSPMLPLYGYVFDSFSERYYPAGFYGRVGVLPLKRLWGFIGVELTPLLTLMKTTEDAYTVNGTMTALTLSGLYRRRFMAQRLAATIRLGGGVAAITGIRYEHNDGSLSEEVGAAFFFAAAGASLEWAIGRGLFVEAGADYIQGISPNSPAPGFIQASAGAGWRF